MPSSRVLFLCAVFFVVIGYGVYSRRIELFGSNRPGAYEPVGASSSKIFGLFSDAPTSPAVCGTSSAYGLSGSGGCTKLTPEQKWLIDSRGGNEPNPGY